MVFVQLWRDGDVFALPQSFWLHKTARFRSSSLPAGHGGKVREMGLAAESAGFSAESVPVGQPEGSDVQAVKSVASWSGCVVLGDLLGQGASSVVHAVDVFDCGFDRQEDELCRTPLVAKIFRIDQDTSIQHVELAIQEAKLLLAAQGHPSIMRSFGLFRAKSGVSEDLLGTFARKKVRAGGRHPRKVLPGDVESVPLHFLVMERCQCSLRDLAAVRCFTEPEAAFAAGSVLRGLAHLHHRNIVHRDVKDSNIMVTDGGRRVVLCDLDMAATLPSADASIDWACGTSGFIAPEVLACQRGSCSSDMFSFGVLLYLLVTGSHPFLEASYEETWDATLRRQIPTEPAGVLANTSQAFVCLLEDVLERDMHRRMTAEDALRHRWVSLEESASLVGLVEQFVSAGAALRRLSKDVLAPPEESKMRHAGAAQSRRARRMWKLATSMLSAASTTASRFRMMGSRPLLRGRARTEDFDAVHPEVGHLGSP